MSRAGALIRARSLREALLDHGVPRVSIEIQQGRPGTPHSRWYDDRFVGSMGHHIVSRRSQGITPGLSLIKRGRSDVPGPLCNGYGGFDRAARIICMGWANHPGVGGPYTLPSGRVPANNGRPYLFGWEFEGGLSLADWPDEMRAFMGSCHAGTLDWLGLRDTSHIEHSTWTPRKIDRLGYTLTSARAEVRENWEDDMAWNDQLKVRPWFDEDWGFVDGEASAELFQTSTYGHARRANDQSRAARSASREARDAARRAEEASVASLAAVQGVDTGAVLARLDEHHAHVTARLDVLDDVAAALADLADGTTDGEAALRRIRDLIDTAVGDD